MDIHQHLYLLLDTYQDHKFSSDFEIVQTFQKRYEIDSLPLEDQIHVIDFFIQGQKIGPFSRLYHGENWEIYCYPYKESKSNVWLNMTRKCVTTFFQNSTYIFVSDET